MRKIASFLVIFLLGFVIFYKYNSFSTSGEFLGLSHLEGSHYLSYFDEKRFYEGVNKASVEGRLIFDKPLGGVVPHDNIASFQIASFFLNLKKQNPHTIILLGPNHEEVGSYKALTSLYNWKTPFGLVEVEESIISDLKQKFSLKIDNDSFANEQSIKVLVPYIKYYLPEASVVPIILKSSFTLQDSKTLGQVLGEYISEQVVLIVSVDFSHYLKSDEATQKDKVTIKMIENYDIEALFKLNSDYLDSPGSVATLLYTMENIESKNMETLYHTNSGELLNNGSIPTTSYFVLTFR